MCSMALLPGGRESEYKLNGFAILTPGFIHTLPYREAVRLCLPLSCA